MAQEDDPEREEINVEQIAITNGYHLEALINVLQSKGIVSVHEVMEELADVAEKQRNKIN